MDEVQVVSRVPIFTVYGITFGEFNPFTKLAEVQEEAVAWGIATGSTVDNTGSGRGLYAFCLVLKDGEPIGLVGKGRRQ